MISDALISPAAMEPPPGWAIGLALLLMAVTASVFADRSSPRDRGLMPECEVAAVIFPNRISTPVSAPDPHALRDHAFVQ